MLVWMGQVEPEVAQVGPKMDPRRLQNISCRIFPLMVATFWDHLGPILGYLGASLALLGGPGGPLEADLGLRRAAAGMICGMKSRLQKPSTT